MAKGDFVKVKYQVDQAIVEDTFTAETAGSTVELEEPKAKDAVPMFSVRVLGRTGKVRRSIRLAAAAVRSIEEVRRDDE